MLCVLVGGFSFQLSPGPKKIFFKEYQTQWVGVESFKQEELIFGLETALGKRFKFEKSLIKNIVRTSFYYRLDPVWVSALIWTESSFNPKAKSPRGARGYMQLMPGTAKEVLENLPGSDLPHWLSPKGNLFLGAFYLKKLLLRFRGNHKLATMAYNLGTSGLLKRMRREGVPKMKYWVNINRRYQKLQREIAKSRQLVKADSVKYL